MAFHPKSATPSIASSRSVSGSRTIRLSVSPSYNQSISNLRSIINTSDGIYISGSGQEVEFSDYLTPMPRVKGLDPSSTMTNFLEN